jgi:prepilin-type N-terminal cleavage/methylation domain-containing protein
VVNLLKGIAVKRKKSAFTLVELLAVLGIIAIVVALLIPAVTTVRKMAKETQQKAQITTIDLGLTAFKNDYGDYPPSNWEFSATGPADYCGAQKLCEALVGWDLLGFHPNSAWRADGKDENGGDTAYTGATTGTEDEKKANLKARKGPYLELATANVFRLGFSSAGAKDGLFDAIDPGGLKGDTYVICDVFGVKSVTIGKKTVKAGTPILYYRANTSKKTIDSGVTSDRIYCARDNVPLTTTLNSILDDTKRHPLGDTGGTYKVFYDYITDPKVAMVKWPSRPDSYLLISAGVDGLYGTKDDICNFDPNS